MDRQSVKISLSNFSIEQICSSGQCFRMKLLENGRYQVIACGRRLELQQNGEEVTFHCSREEYEAIWKKYFDLDMDYKRFIEGVDPQDPYLVQAAAYGCGIRILNQDLWEMIITFIISQQNHIKRIRKCIETICERYGKACDGFYDFPTPEALAAATEQQLRVCGLGYRSRYLVNTAKAVACGQQTAWTERLNQMNYTEAKEELMKLSGVGSKVADCICLFALHQLDAFPVDTHIRQVLDVHYPEGFPTDKYKGYLGVLQQYIFYYDLNFHG